MPRQSIPLKQKIALRERRRAHPNLTNSDLQNWFKTTFNRPISSSSVSDILGNRFAYLETASPSVRADSSKRRREEKWPDLEEALFQWTKHAEQSIIITCEVLRFQAERFWQKMPQYKHHPTPAFSNGWLYKFQQRKGIKYRVQHGEAASVPETAEAEMVPIRVVLQKYAQEDIYNCEVN